MRKAALLALPVFLSGCSGFGKFLGETVALPGGNPNAPAGMSENLERARGHAYNVTPILPEQGNIWPGAPQPLPTLRDVDNSHRGLADSLTDPGSYFGSMTNGADAVLPTGPQMNDGSKMSIGEQHDIHSGVRIEQPPYRSSEVQDNAGKYGGSHDRSGTIIIPNRDGTNAVIAPDGTVKVRRDAASGAASPTHP